MIALGFHNPGYVGALAPGGPPAGYAGITAFGNYEETDTAHILRSSGWTAGGGSVHSGGACIYCTDAGRTITVKFWLPQPARFSFTSITDPSLGGFLLQLDGLSYGAISQNAAGGGNAHVLYTSGVIAAGQHTLVATANGGGGGTAYIWDLFSLTRA